MHMPYVNSSAIRFIDYDPTTKILRITFTTGNTYDYFNVPQHIYDGLISASSKGGYYNDYIRDTY
jgi:hypothetical protein